MNEACDPHRAAEGLLNHHQPLLTKLTRSPRTGRAMHPQPNLATWKGGRVLPSILLTPISTLARGRCCIGSLAAVTELRLHRRCAQTESARARSRRSTADHRKQSRIQGGQRPNSMGAKTRHTDACTCSQYREALKLCMPGPIVGGRALHPCAHDSDV